MVSLKIDDFQNKINIPETEHKVLDFWDETKAFKKSIESRNEKKRFVFYDGPPFATGLPHYGHILASTIKDVVPRYWTMKGYQVDRVWGWDCHGLPIENIIEKELDLKGGKKGIEEMGIDKFNAACRSAIFRFDKDWEVIIRRMGRWVNFKNSYKTMDLSYMESVWWAFKRLHEKGLIYEGKRVILYCPRCATPLSNFEIAMDNSYKEVKDNSIYVKFKLKNKLNEYFVAWTTTPWTLIGNVALAVDPNANYLKVQIDDDLLWIAEKLKETLFKDANIKNVESKKGSELVNLEYEPLYNYMPHDGKKAHYVGPGDFVSMEDGTGIVHTAAIFGEDDYEFAKKLDLPRVPTLDDQGKFLDFVEPLKGMFYKKSETWIIDDLKMRNLLFKAEKITHSYPFCYRCETPLYYNAIPAWFINVQKIKNDLKKQNENINWYPSYLKHGRFGKGLDTAPDWNISRSRYWGTPMPVWQSPDGDKTRIIGSVQELKRWAVDSRQVENITDIHREFIDDIEIWVDDKKTVEGRRIPEVFDCWVESGSMPYASLHYPFENKALFDSTHPAQFIAEYIAQTRAWFYTLHVMSVGLFGKNTFENAVTTGTILAENGDKMSKSKRNFPDPTLLFEKYGVDSLRFYLMSSTVMKAENTNFSESQVKEVYQKVISILWNTFTFYKLYTKDPVSNDMPQVSHILDKWIASKTHRLIRDVTKSMDKYDVVASCRLIKSFIDDLSTWYLRRSRDRFKTDTKSMEVFAWVLKSLALIMAPITPFICELIYQNITKKQDSVHLQLWPKFDEKYISDEIEEEVLYSRKIVEMAHAVRKNEGIRVRQPLKQFTIHNSPASPAGRQLIISDELISLIKKELNVKAVEFVKGKGDLSVVLDTEITPELKAEGDARELVRNIQKLRKQKGCKVDELVKVTIPEMFKGFDQSLISQIKKQALVSSIVWGEELSISTG